MNGRIPIQTIELTSIGKVFGAVVALRRLSATFRPGCLHLLLGSNGSGKSTLLSLLASISRPSTGQIFYNGHTLTPQLRGEIGWVSHEGLVYPDLSGRELLRLAAALYGLDPRGVVEQARERFALGRFMERPFRTNSRGQQQRLSLARALIHAPSLVLLDEPTTGLDAEGVSLLLRVVREEVERGALVVLATHDDPIFGGFQRRVMRLERGLLVETQDIAEGGNLNDAMAQG